MTVKQVGRPCEYMIHFRLGPFTVAVDVTCLGSPELTPVVITQGFKDLALSCNVLRPDSNMESYFIRSVIAH